MEFPFLSLASNVMDNMAKSPAPIVSFLFYCNRMILSLSSDIGIPSVLRSALWLLIGCAIAVFLLELLTIWYKSGWGRIPGPWPFWPVIGSVAWLVSDPYGFWMNQAAYGDISWNRLAGWFMVHCATPQLARKVFENGGHDFCSHYMIFYISLQISKIRASSECEEDLGREQHCIYARHKAQGAPKEAPSSLYSKGSGNLSQASGGNRPKTSPELEGHVGNESSAGSTVSLML